MSATTTVLRCAHCGAPVSYQSEFCAYCRAPQCWPIIPDIARGAPRVQLTFPSDPLPGASALPAGSVTRVEGGARVDVRGDQALSGGPAVASRDSCTSVTGTALDASGSIGVGARTRFEGSATTGYVLTVLPGQRCFLLERSIVTTKVRHADVLRAWEFSAAIRGVGLENEVELRCADSVLRAFVNGELLATLIDARFGFGHSRWQISSCDGHPTAFVLRSFSIWRAT